MKGMPFYCITFFSLLLSVAVMVSIFKTQWVFCHIDSNGEYPASIACKTAKLCMFSDEHSQHGHTTDTYVVLGVMVLP